MKPSRTPGMKVITLLIVLACEKSGPGMAARRMQAAWRAKADFTIRTSKALFEHKGSVLAVRCERDVVESRIGEWRRRTSRPRR